VVPPAGVATIDGTVKSFALKNKACGIPIREFACARGDFGYRDEARRSIGSGSAVRYEVCDWDTASGNRKALALLDAAHDRAAIVPQFSLTDRCCHRTSVVQARYA